ncbi:hypothetical protein ACFVT5_13550 [Streptomyces sp. NPDC058001]
MTPPDTIDHERFPSPVSVGSLTALHADTFGRADEADPRWWLVT